jgi:hypothetical protein
MASAIAVDGEKLSIAQKPQPEAITTWRGFARAPVVSNGRP